MQNTEKQQSPFGGWPSWALVQHALYTYEINTVVFLWQGDKVQSILERSIHGELESGCQVALHAALLQSVVELVVMIVIIAIVIVVIGIVIIIRKITVSVSWLPGTQQGDQGMDLLSTVGIENPS